MLETIWNENWIWLSAHFVNFVRFILMSVGIALCVGILHKQLEDNEAVRLIVLGVFLFLTEFIVISAILFQVDGWGITTTLVIEVMINGALYGQMSFLNGKSRDRQRINWSCKPYLPMLCVCLTAVLMAHNINGYYGMQQDQGVYQTSAIAMIYGNADNEKELTAYQRLLLEDQERYMQIVPTAINGFYFYDEDLEGLYTKEFQSECSGYFHGIPTYPALLALWGGIFGLRFMGGIQIIIYLLLLAIGYFLLCDWGCKRGTAALGCGLVAISPMILWVAKSTLTEMYLACALLAFMYFLTREEKAAIWLSAISIIGFGCIHLSLYTIMPVVILIYAGLFVRYRVRTYVGAGILTTAGFWFATNLTRTISTEYFYLNIEPLVRLLPWINRENVMTFITVICAMLIILGMIIFKFIPDHNTTTKMNCKWAPVFIRLIVVLWCILTIISVISIGIRTGDGLQKGTASVWGYAVLSGLVMLPIGLIGILAKPQLLWKDKASALQGALFTYCVLVYSLAFRREIPYYYYYGRYLVPFIPFVIWQGIRVLMLTKGKMRAAVYGIIVVAQLLLLPYDFVLLAQKDDTRMSWEALEEVCNELSADDVIIIDDTLLNTCYLPLTFMSQAKVLPQMQYPPSEVMNIYAAKRGETYYLSSGQTEIGQTFTVLRSSYMVSEDDQSGDRGLLGLPIRMFSDVKYLQMDRLFRANYFYSAEDDCWIDMYIDENGYRCGYGSEYGLSVYLGSKDYEVHLKQGTAIPLEIYGVEFYPVKVYVNGAYLVEIKVYQEKGIEEIIFDIPSYYLRNGENVIMFCSDPWKPQDLGEQDYRKLGINIDKIWFEKK